MRDTAFDDNLTGSPTDNEGFFLSSGSDAVDGGGGLFDTDLFLDAAVSVTIDLPQGTATGEGIDTSLVGIQDLIGSPFDDTIIGNELDNFIWGREGNDQVAGGPGADFVETPLGNDPVDGGEGNDIAAFGFAGGPVTLDLAAQTATIDSNPDENPTLAGMDSAFGSFEFPDTLAGNDGPNDIIGLGGGDEIDGLAGDDFLDGDFLEAGAVFPGKDDLDGGDGNDSCTNGETDTNCELEPAPRPYRPRALVVVSGVLPNH